MLLFILIQVIYNPILTTKVAGIDCKYIDVQPDNYKVVSLTFQNDKYQHITNIGSIVILEEDIPQLIEDLSYRVQNSTITRKRYSITVSRMVYLHDGSKYKALTFNQTQKLIDFLSKLNN